MRTDKQVAGWIRICGWLGVAAFATITVLGGG